MGCVNTCMNAKASSKRKHESTAEKVVKVKAARTPLGDLNLPTAQKRYSDKSQRPSHFGRLSIAINEEEKEGENKPTDEESTG